MSVAFVPIRILLTSLLCVCVCSVAEAQPKPPSRALSSEQIRQLIANRTPDSVIAKELSERGVSFTIDDAAIGSLANAGAGAEVLAALRGLQPKGTVIVQAKVPGVMVFIDNQDVGVTGEDGTLRIDAPVGTRRLSAKKASAFLSSKEVSISVSASEELHAPVAMEIAAYRPGAGITAPRPTKEVQPTYTPAAQKAKIQGIVWLECVVLPDGTVGQVEVIRSLDATLGLDQQAIAAANAWTFTPGLRQGVPVPVKVTIELTFRLP